MFQVLLLYKYIHISDPEAVKGWQIDLCKKLDLKGRLIVAKEGINFTLEGTTENTEQYIVELTSDERFSDINIKKSIGNGNAFPKLSIKVRPEIVSAHLGDKDIDPVKSTAPYITIEELHQKFRNKEELYIVDMRNDYEHKSGHFKDSVLANMSNFRDLPKVIEQISHLKDKQIVTVCTGGVRCEKASGFLVENGFSNVRQLKDGIVTYMEKYPNEDFLGKLYVFDSRILVGFNTSDPEHQIIGKCDLCGNTSENYLNCANNSCHHHFICCEECMIDGVGYCSEECKATSKVL